MTSLSSPQPHPFDLDLELPTPKPTLDAFDDGTGFVPSFGDVDDAALRAVPREVRDTIYAEAKAAASQEVEERLQQIEGRQQELLGSLLGELRAEWEVLFTDLTRTTLDLALLVAERILRRELDLDPSVVERVVHNALWKIPQARRLHVRVNPDDADRLQSDPELLKDLRIDEVVADRRVQRGGCLIEVEGQTLDGTIDGQLEQVRAAMDKALEEA